MDFKSLEIKNSLKKIVSCLEYDIFNKSNHFSFHLSKNDKIKKIAIQMNLHKKSMKEIEDERKYKISLKAENKIKLV